jgi:hypothetical protein
VHKRPSRQYRPIVLVVRPAVIEFKQVIIFKMGNSSCNRLDIVNQMDMQDFEILTDPVRIYKPRQISGLTLAPDNTTGNSKACGLDLNIPIFFKKLINYGGKSIIIPARKPFFRNGPLQKETQDEKANLPYVEKHSYQIDPSAEPVVPEAI